MLLTNVFIKFLIDFFNYINILQRFNLSFNFKVENVAELFSFTNIFRKMYYVKKFKCFV